MTIPQGAITTKYPYLASAFAHITQGEAHLHRLQDLNTAWHRLPGSTRQYGEVVGTSA